MRTNTETRGRKRRTAAELAALDARIVATLAGDHPQSVRHVFYRMTDPRLPEAVPKTENGYRLVQRRCLSLRRSGRLDYGWISDTTRAGFHVATYRDGGAFLRRVAGLYRADLWADVATHVEVWCESRSLAGVLRSTCAALAVSLYPSGGFASATLCYEAAGAINDTGKARAVVLYVGDYDPAGVLIDRSIEGELSAHLYCDLEFRRLAVNPEQIEAMALPTKPRKAGDRRAPHVADTVEAEAVPAGTMRAMVRDAVEAYLPPGALDAAKAAEASEREYLYLLGEKRAG